MRTEPAGASLRRFRRARRWPLLLLPPALLVLAGLLSAPSDNQTFDPYRVTVASGAYRLIGIADDGAIVVQSPADSGGPPSWLVRFLGVEMIDRKSACSWLRRCLPEQIKLRFDRRRLDDHGRLQAYVQVNDRLINAELVRRGWARPATHPSDAGPLVRQIKRAAWEAR